MKFTMEINLGGAEMNTAQHVAAALCDVAEGLAKNCNGNLVEHGRGFSGGITAMDGEEVGEWRIGSASDAPA